MKVYKKSDKILINKGETKVSHIAISIANLDLKNNGYENRIVLNVIFKLYPIYNTRTKNRQKADIDKMLNDIKHILKKHKFVEGTQYDKRCKL